MHSKLICCVVICISVVQAEAQKSPANVVSVTAAEIKIAELFGTFNVVGKCVSNNSRDYYANVAGRVDMVSTAQGQKVKKNDVLLVIDHDIAIGTRTQAEAALSAAQDLHTRNQALFAKKYISQEGLDNSTRDLAIAKLNFSKALKTYNDMFITAPFDGTMGVITLKVGDDIKQGDYLFSILGKSGTQDILLELPASLNHAVSNTTRAIVYDNQNNQISSTIAAVAQYVSDTGTLNAKITIPYNANILHGGYVDVALIINPHRNFAVPQQCVQRNNNGNFIYKIENNVVRQIYAKIGTRTNNLIEIIATEIHEGDLVVSDGFTKIDDGVAVEVLSID